MAALGAENEVAVVAGETVTLAPTLRHAVHTLQHHGQPGSLSKSINANSLDTMVALLSDHCQIPHLKQQLIHSGTDHLKQPLIRYLVSLSGVDPDQPTDQWPRIAGGYAELYDALYGMATGWIGWTPTETWNATPREILVAFNSRLEFLNAASGKVVKPDTDGTTDAADASA